VTQADVRANGTGEATQDAVGLVVGTVAASPLTFSVGVKAGLPPSATSSTGRHRIWDGVQATVVSTLASGQRTSVLP
jgi:hypothetical protein